MSQSTSVNPMQVDDKTAALKKKEKELTQRSQDLDRRRKLIEEAEEKQGAVAQREAALEQRERDIATQLREVKRREKNAKDMEVRVSDAREAVSVEESRLSEKAASLDKSQIAVTEREERYETKLEQIEKKEAAVKQREKRAQEQDAVVLQRRAEIQKLWEEAEQLRVEAFAADEDVKARAKDLQRRAEAVERDTRAAQTKLAQLQRQEELIQRDREELRAQQKTVATEEKDLRHEREQMAKDEKDCVRRKREAEIAESSAKKRREEAEAAVAELGSVRDLVRLRQRQIDEQEATLRALEDRCVASEEDVAAREQALLVEAKAVRQREAALESKEEQLRQQADQLVETKRELQDQADEQTQHEAKVKSREEAAAALHQHCLAMAAAAQRRQEALDGKEKDLVSWMKEMQWREMMLGEQEETVARQPVNPIATLSPMNTPMQMGNRGPGTGSVAKKRDGSPSAAGKEDAFSEGFGHRAFGHALVSVQFRRLKDQYVSAQMKHARSQVADEEDKRRSVSERRMRRARAGIEVSQLQNPVSEEAELESGLAELEKAAHAERLTFVRAMAKLRAFDGFESPTSPERLAELEQFSAAEQSVLATAANLEYVLQSVQRFLQSIQSSPLDHKDRATDVQDLVNRTSRWWAAAKNQARNTLQQLLSDRRHYLRQGIAVLSSAANDSSSPGRPTTAPSRAASPRSATGAEATSPAPQPEGSPSARTDHTTPRRKSTDSAVRRKSRSGSRKQSMPSADPVAVVGPVPETTGWPYTKELLAPEVRQVPPYRARNTYDHVKESTILAPRGLATLRAASAAASSTPQADAPLDRSGTPSPPKALQPESSDQQRPGTSADTRHSGSGLSPPPVTTMARNCAGGEFRSPLTHNAENCIVDIGRYPGAGAPPQRNFSLNRFLEQDVAQRPPSVSPYAVPLLTGSASPSRASTAASPTKPFRGSTGRTNLPPATKAAGTTPAHR